ncbi:MAG: chemotaxis-specific protein-glutamate methyltransferase CheB [Rhodocyclaceae bacterium]|nr:chemotaxis-specific protein-glutamate methyltransferase CheB [Rhodocyclaceae bacterium]
MIRILIADDSRVISQLLKIIFESESDMQVVGIAADGREAVRLAQELRPDVMTMDIRMPVMDGFEATRLIMSSQPVPIVVISASVDDAELRTTFRAIEEGALAVIEKPVGLSHPEFEAMRREITDTVRAMAALKVFRRRAQAKQPAQPMVEAERVPPGRVREIVAIGCSTGGPQALQAVLGTLPASFPLPIAIAQHMSKGFIGGLAEWLRSQSLLNIRLVTHGEQLKPGTVYFAPDDFHLRVVRDAHGLVAQLSQEGLINGFRPSATPLLQSVAQTCQGGGIGVLLTGMGCDGAVGLLAMRQAGAHTLVQDQVSAVVYGMPGAAIAIDAVDRIVNLKHMAAYLQSLAMPSATGALRTAMIAASH